MLIISKIVEILIITGVLALVILVLYLISWIITRGIENASEKWMKENFYEGLTKEEFYKKYGNMSENRKEN